LLDYIVNSEPHQLLWNRSFGEEGIIKYNSPSNWLVSFLLAHGNVSNCWICESEFLLNRCGLISFWEVAVRTWTSSKGTRNQPCIYVVSDVISNIRQEQGWRS
jgi:hypothetical protein